MMGDRFAGETFRQDFQDQGIAYEVCPWAKSGLSEALEPVVNAGEVALLDVPKLQEQLLGLVVRGTRIDHLTGEHDDLANAAAGAVWAAAHRESAGPRIISLGDGGPCFRGLPYPGADFGDWLCRG